MIRKTHLWVASNNCMTGRSIERHTCVQPVMLGLCPKRKNHPLCGWIFIVHHKTSQPLIFRKSFSLNCCPSSSLAETYFVLSHTLLIVVNILSFCTAKELINLDTNFQCICNLKFALLQ